MIQIAYCFLVYDGVKHGKIWEDYFSQDQNNSHTIYSHVKQTTEKTQQFIKKHKVHAIKTDYCDVSLVYAWIVLLRKALENPNNKYFCILSGECIPLFPYQTVYKKIKRSKKSRMNLETDAEPTVETGYYWCDQWCILNRKQAKLLLNLRDTEEGKNYTKEFLKKIDGFCSDEMLPINWFVKHYGKPSTASFKKEIMIKQTTYTYWDGIHSSPRKFNAPQMRKMKSKICSSGAVFGRKFNAKAARELSMDC